MRIGLIAISGVRVQDQELLELGLTLPGFVERSKVIASLPSLGLLTLAGMTPGNHECVYLEIEDVAKMDALHDGFDLVAISSFSAQIHEAYALADQYRASGTPVVLGGLHATAQPEEAGAHADAVVIGEAEAVWSRLLEDAERGALRQVYESDGSFDLATAPMPAFELLEIDKYNRLTVQASRGCPHRCEFCANSLLLSRCYKQKPVEKVIAEIDRICGFWKRPFIEFADDNALVDKRYWRELLRELKHRNVRWFAETDLSVHEDDELLALMRESGCSEVLIGFESPFAAGLDGLELNSNWKVKHWPEYVQAVRNIQSAGIRVNGCFVLGLDGHTPEVFDAVYDFARRSELFDVQITVLTPFPGTPLYDRLAREDRLLNPTAWQKCTLFDVNFLPQPMTIDELHGGLHDLAARLYSEEESQWRKETFNHKYLRARN